MQSSATGRASSRFRPISSPQFPVQWVKVFHPLLGTGSKQGFVELGEPVNAYEDPNASVPEEERGHTRVDYSGLFSPRNDHLLVS